MRRFILTLAVLLYSVFIVMGAQQITLKLTDGTTISGEIGKSSFNSDGVALMQNGTYGRRVPYKKLSQESLKQLAENPMAQKYVEMLIEFIPDDKPKEKPVPKKIEINPPPKIERPNSTSFFGALFQSPVTLTLLILIYIANIYAGYEVAIFKNRQAILVSGVAAVFPILGLVLFLVLPSVPLKTAEELAEEEGAAEQQAEGPPTIALPKQATEQQEEQKEQGPPPMISFLRGQYIFNRRFFETKFAGFLRAVPGEEEKDKEIVFVTLRGTYIAKRLSKLTANEVFILVKKGDASEEIMIPFTEIREVHIKHQDVPFNTN